MKKNKALTAAFSVFALTMMSMCAIGGTFAKYVTTDTDTDTARVAKWGVTVTASANEAAVTEIDGGAETHVKTNTGDIMAPGTKGTFVTVNIAGTPEVAVTVEHEATVDFGDNWTVKNGEKVYIPIVVVVNNVEIKNNDFLYTDVSEFEGMIKGAIESKDSEGASINPNTNIDSPYDLDISWYWTFEGDNVRDTALGDLATTPSITITVITTVTQVD